MLKGFIWIGLMLIISAAYAVPLSGEADDLEAVRSSQGSPNSDDVKEDGLDDPSERQLFPSLNITGVLNAVYMLLPPPLRTQLNQTISALACLTNGTNNNNGNRSSTSPFRLPFSDADQQQEAPSVRVAGFKLFRPEDEKIDEEKRKPSEEKKKQDELIKYLADEPVPSPYPVFIYRQPVPPSAAAPFYRQSPHPYFYGPPNYPDPYYDYQYQQPDPQYLHYLRHQQGPIRPNSRPQFRQPAQPSLNPTDDDTLSDLEALQQLEYLLQEEMNDPRTSVEARGLLSSLTSGANSVRNSVKSFVSSFSASFPSIVRKTLVIPSLAFSSKIQE